jgi:hypothetical protein
MGSGHAATAGEGVWQTEMAFRTQPPGSPGPETSGVLRFLRYFLDLRIPLISRAISSWSACRSSGVPSRKTFQVLGSQPFPNSSLASFTTVTTSSPPNVSAILEMRGAQKAQAVSPSSPSAETQTNKNHGRFPRRPNISRAGSARGEWAIFEESDNFFQNLTVFHVIMCRSHAGHVSFEHTIPVQLGVPLQIDKVVFHFAPKPGERRHPKHTYRIGFCRNLRIECDVGWVQQLTG